MALDPVRGADALRATPALFASPRLDRLTRAHPAVPALLHGPVAVALTTGGVVSGGWITTAAFVLAGYLVWTLTEYWLHRVVFHHVPPGRWGQRLQWTVHGVHHEHPNDSLRLVFPPVVSLPVAVVVVLGTHAALGPQRGYAAAAGFVIGYVVYDTLHHHLHRRRPTTRLGRHLRRRHMQHHFRDDSTGFGVSCPYWDHLFGTAPGNRRSTAPADTGPCAGGRRRGPHPVRSAAYGLPASDTERTSEEPEQPDAPQGARGVPLPR
jgi:sterol desaturase/sphingolipid hydroxylase (fatty acid hydroxylase superfamily)